MFQRYSSNKGDNAETPSRPPASTPTRTTSAPQPSNSRPPQPTKPAAAHTTPASSKQVPATSGRNVLSSDVEIKGKVKFSNDLVVDGKIEGEILSDGSLTVGENARIKAEIQTRSIVIYGKVHGNINVSDRVELKANAELVGDIKAATLSIEAGATFVGKSTVGTPSSQPNKGKQSAENGKKQAATAS